MPIAKGSPWGWHESLARSSLPDDFADIPVFNDLSATFYAFCDNARCDEGDIDRLWEAFETRLPLRAIRARRCPCRSTTSSCTSLASAGRSPWDHGHVLIIDAK